MKISGTYWQASEARNSFSDLMQRALNGETQIVRHRNGEEIVIMSRAAFEASRPTLKDYLLKGGPRNSDDNDLEEVIAENRANGFGLFGKLPVNKE
ncbi:MAG: type II toxin-antitoxin system prevent-host-death family antitoxin [Rhodospirillaceae bacterium]|nr:MAG: type II toxin-antitoxin system prevent-host-death family antitoxin [Rhodospirillaceae bacterium]